VPENIRFLVQNYPRVSAVLTGSRRLKRLREEYWSALFGLGTRIPLTSLDAEAARDLVIRPVRSLLTYSDEAVERVIHLTARQPFLVQCLCSKVYDSAAQLGRRSVTREFVDEASRGLVEDNEHFAFLWDFLARESRRLLLALCHREAEGPDPLTIGLMEELLSGFGLEIEEKTLIDDLEFLIELELLERAERAGGKSYLPALPLMGYWIRRHQDFTVLVKRAAMGLGG
ncbi:MAG: restriction endonuclease subunit M, partial [Verrucomicrobia bacterium]|nr:restriction endonuclease subunit M [Verrucomicrobiota bacterium]